MNVRIITIALGVLFSFSCFSIIPKEYCNSRQVMKENKTSVDKKNIYKFRYPTKTEWEYAIKACPPMLNYVNIAGEKYEKSLNYRFPTKAEWEYAIKACPPITNYVNIGGEKYEKFLNYRLPTETEWEYAIKKPSMNNLKR